MRKTALLFYILLGFSTTVQAECASYTAIPASLATLSFTDGVIGKIKTGSNSQGDPEFTIFMESYVKFSTQTLETCQVFKIGNSNISSATNPTVASLQSALKIALTAYTLNYYLEAYNLEANPDRNTYTNASGLALKRRPLP